MLTALRALPDNSIVVLHACCHNPTGVDLSAEQWKQVVALFQERPLVPYLDFAYQGFGAGLEEDAFAVRAFAEAGIPCLISSSFSKSLSLYRERVGAMTFLTASPEEAKRVLSQGKRVVRTNYSSPASHGGQIAALILTDSELRSLWEGELTEMRERIFKMRGQFVEGLKAKGVTQDFSFIARQRGMFSYSGLNVEQVRKLRADNSLYIVESGRICVAAMNERNLPVIIEAIASVL
jgi:aromatic-amino-acid transaminase